MYSKMAFWASERGWNPCSFHQPFHALLAHRHALCLQLVVDARAAIGLAALPMDGRDVNGQGPVLASARALGVRCFITP